MNARGILLILLLGWGASASATDDAPQATRHIRYGFTLENARSKMMPRADLWTYAPIRATSFQRRVRLRASHPYRLVEDDTGNEILHFSFENLPPFATRVITIDADVAVSDEPSPQPVAAGEYLGPGRLMETDDPDFADLAARFRIRPGRPVPEEAYRFVRGTVEDGGYDATDRGALYALQTGRGDCTEFASLFGALCRRGGIPARVMGGYLLSGNGILDANGYHNWAEFYRDGAWHVADCQKDVFGPGGIRYVAMQVVADGEGPMKGHPRYRYEGAGLKVTMNGQ